MTARALALAAVKACDLKESFGTMANPLQAGREVRNGVLAAALPEAGLTASVRSIDGPQGLLMATQSVHSVLRIQLDRNTSVDDLHGN